MSTGVCVIVDHVDQQLAVGFAIVSPIAAFEVAGTYWLVIELYSVFFEPIDKNLK
jgi:hypothetical protein